MKESEVMNKLLFNMSDSIFTSLIGKVESIDKTVNKITVQPQHKVLLDGVLTLLPKLVDVPLWDFGNGSYFIRPPITKGDFVPLIIIDYDIQNLVLSGELKEVNAEDIHSMTDAIALPFNLNPFNNTLDTSHENDLLIQTPNAKIFIDPSGKITLNGTGGIDILSAGDINLTTTGTADINLNGDKVNVTERNT